MYIRPVRLAKNFGRSGFDNNMNLSPESHYFDCEIVFLVYFIT